MFVDFSSFNEHGGGGAYVSWRNGQKLGGVRFEIEIEEGVEWFLTHTGFFHGWTAENVRRCGNGGS